MGYVNIIVNDQRQLEFRVPSMDTRGAGTDKRDPTVTSWHVCAQLYLRPNAPGVTVKLKIGLKWENSLSGFLLPGT